MNLNTQYLISKDNGKLQLPYGEYVSLMEKAEEASRVLKVKSEVLAGLQAYLDGQPATPEQAPEQTPEQSRENLDEDKLPVDDKSGEPVEKVSVEFSAESEEEAGPSSKKEKKQGSGAGKAGVDIPSIKKEIAAHFNAHDESGRLFNVFKQYYTCLNESCGGTVRVTMKDGVCSFWNYDEWEEFAFVDILDGDLRFAVDPRYTDDLASLSFCEASRLLASRRSVVAIQLGDLNKTMLKVLAQAFNEVGMTAS